MPNAAGGQKGPDAVEGQQDKMPDKVINYLAVDSIEKSAEKRSPVTAR